MVIGVSGIGLKRRTAELRIGQDEVLRERIKSEHSPIDADRNDRQIGVDSARLAVVEGGQSRGERDVVAIGEAVAYRTARRGAQMLGSSLQYAIEDRSYCSESGACDVDALEHLVQ